MNRRAHGDITLILFNKIRAGYKKIYFSKAIM